MAVKENELFDEQIETGNSEKEQKEMLAQMAAQEEFLSESEEVKNEIENEPDKPKKQTISSEEQDEMNEAFTAMLDPAIIIAAIDGFAVFASKFIFKAVGIEYNKEAIQLTTQEKASLKPPLKAYLKTLNLNLTPLTALLLGFGMIYGSKIGIIITDAKLTGKATAMPKNNSNYEPKKRGSYKKKNLKIQL